MSREERKRKERAKQREGLTMLPSSHTPPTMIDNMGWLVRECGWVLHCYPLFPRFLVSQGSDHPFWGCAGNPAGVGREVKKEHHFTQYTLTIENASAAKATISLGQCTKWRGGRHGGRLWSCSPAPSSFFPPSYEAPWIFCRCGPGLLLQGRPGPCAWAA